MSLSNTFETTSLQWAFTTDSVTRPTAWYVALGSAASDSSFTEISGSGYTRKSATFTVSGNTASNSGAVTFDVATGDWNSGSSITHFAIYTASSGGTYLGYSSLDTARTVLTDSQPSFAIGALTITSD